MAVGRQTARAFLAVTLGKVAQQARGGTLTIPLDTSTTDGSIAPSSAHITVCVTYQAVTDVEGYVSIGAPSANCLPAAHAKYVAKPAPHLVANLKRLGGKLAGVKGFALLPVRICVTTDQCVRRSSSCCRPPRRRHRSCRLLKLLVGGVSCTPKPISDAQVIDTTALRQAGSSTGLGDGTVLGPEPITLPTRGVGGSNCPASSR